MSIPAFVDRLNVSAQKQVLRGFFTEPITQRSTTVFRTIGIDPAAIAPPDEGYHILATTSLYVRDATATALRAVDFVASSAQALVGSTGGDIDVQMTVNANDVVIVGQTPVIFVDTVPRNVFWS